MDSVLRIRLMEKTEPFHWARGKRLHVYRRFMDTYGAATNSDEGDGEDYFETYRRIGNELTAEAVKLNKGSFKIDLTFDHALKGHNNLAKAQDSIAKALMPQRDEQGRNIGPCRMRIFNNLYETIDEFENVRFPKSKARIGDDFTAEQAAKREADEKVVTYQKHCLDCQHYIETGRPEFRMLKRERPPAPYDPNIVR